MGKTHWLVVKGTQGDAIFLVGLQEKCHPCATLVAAMRGPESDVSSTARPSRTVMWSCVSTSYGKTATVAAMAVQAVRTTPTAAQATIEMARINIINALLFYKKNRLFKKNAELGVHSFLFQGNNAYLYIVDVLVYKTCAFRKSEYYCNVLSHRQR